MFWPGGSQKDPGGGARLAVQPSQPASNDTALGIALAHPHLPLLEGQEGLLRGVDASPRSAGSTAVDR